ncbi:hypothetical protein HY492_02435 [Candidatus Woesearchaeota archaeon]|nr:hypothetical protein [Candidatus Woesearchaeota archaeon]
MKKLIGLIALLVLAACSSGAPAVSTEMPVPGSDADEMVVEESFTDNLASIFSSGTAAKCVVTSTDGEATIYVSGMNQRMDAMANGDTMHSIVDSSTIYIWTDRENKGFKMSKRAMEDTASQASQYQGQTPETYASSAPDANVRCSPWVVSGSMFMPPSNVEFQDLDEMMAQVQQMQQSGQMPSNFNQDDY